jgi:hypothetical protein
LRSAAALGWTSAEAIRDAIDDYLAMAEEGLWRDP